MKREDLLLFLDNKGIKCEMTEPHAVYTIEEKLKANLIYPDLIAKNLFIRDDKKKSYYLITVRKARAVNLKEFQMQFKTRKLSFASENNLISILGVVKGYVTLFGLLSNQEHRIHFLLTEF